MSEEVRRWLRSEGHGNLPVADGRVATLRELQSAIASVASAQAHWGVGEFRDCSLRTSDGKHTHIVVGVPNDSNGNCQFHFRGGDLELVEAVVTALSAIVGPQLLQAHSGSVTKVIQVSGNCDG
jgi:hypothetical protein